jgi:hypothetical protein
MLLFLIWDEGPRHSTVQGRCNMYCTVSVKVIKTAVKKYFYWMRPLRSRDRSSTYTDKGGGPVAASTQWFCCFIKFMGRGSFKIALEHICANCMRVAYYWWLIPGLERAARWGGEGVGGQWHNRHSRSPPPSLLPHPCQLKVLCRETR